MANEDGLKLEKFHHIGVIVKDRDAVIEQWSSLFGLGRWNKIDPPGGPMKKMAFVKAGGTLFELLEPTEEKSLWRDFLETNGEGLHHVCIASEDVDGDVESLVAKGAEVMVHQPGAFAYVKTKGYGDLILEVMKKPS